MTSSTTHKHAEYQRFSEAFLPHQRFMNAYYAVIDAISYSGIEDEPPCLHITGPAGVGKTTLKNKLGVEYPVIADGRKIVSPGSPDLTTNSVPLLQFDFPPNPTVISVAQAILRAYGDPRWNKGDRANLTYRVDLAIVSSGTVALLGDEAQRMVDRNGIVVKDELLDWIKERHARNRCVIVLLGLGRLRHLFERDAQIERRWDAEIRLEPYRWLMNDGKPDVDDQANFIAIVQALQNVSPIPFSRDLQMDQATETEVDLIALRFFFASQGLIGRLKKLHKMALREFKRENVGDSKIDLPLLKQAYAAAFGRQSVRLQNPFDSSWTPFFADGSIQLPAPVEDDTAPLHVARRSRPTKKQIKNDLRQSLRKG